MTPNHQPPSPPPPPPPGKDEFDTSVAGEEDPGAALDVAVEPSSPALTPPPPQNDPLASRTGRHIPT